MLKVISTHYDAVTDGRAALYDAAYPNDAAFQVRIGNDASIRNDRLPQSRAVNLCTRQGPRMRVDRRLRFEKAILGNNVGQIQIGLIESPDGSNILPDTLKDKCAYVSVFDRVWDDMFAEIHQIVLQTFDQ